MIAVEGGVGRGGQEVSPEGQAGRERRCGGEGKGGGVGRRVAEEARALRAAGKLPSPGAVLTPLAKEIMEGKK